MFQKIKIIALVLCCGIVFSTGMDVSAKEQTITPWVETSLSVGGLCNLFGQIGMLKEAKGSDNIEETLMQMGVVEKYKLPKEEKHSTVVSELESADIARIVDIPHEWHSEFKCYMPYTAIRSVSSPQYKLTRSSNAHTNEYGIRMYKNRYCIACGSRVATKIGTKIDVILSNGNIIPCILGDQKADGDTIDRIRGGDNSITEFLVDYSVFLGVTDPSGTVNFVPGWDGKIEALVVYK